MGTGGRENAWGTFCKKSPKPFKKLWFCKKSPKPLKMLWGRGWRGKRPTAAGKGLESKKRFPAHDGRKLQMNANAFSLPRAVKDFLRPVKKGLRRMRRPFYKSFLRFQGAFWGGKHLGRVRDGVPRESYSTVTNTPSALPMVMEYMPSVAVSTSLPPWWCAVTVLPSPVTRKVTVVSASVVKGLVWLTNIAA